MAQYWFKPKRYGFGAMPTTWEGWAVTFGTVLLMVAGSLFLRTEFRNFWGLAALVVFDVAVLAALLMVCRRKTDGEMRWRWGSRN